MTIVAAALKIGDEVTTLPAPARHADIRSHCRKLGKVARFDVNLVEVPGFMTDKGEFLNRRQAADHVIKCGQETKSAYINDKLGLYTEDLW